MSTRGRVVVKVSLGLGALAAFAGLYLLSPVLAMDVDVLGIDEDILRDVAHVTVYGLLAATLAVALRSQGHFPGRAWVLAWIAAVALAGGEEAYQAFVPGRYSAWSDAALNTAGITAALAIGVAVVALRRHVVRRGRSYPASVPGTRWDEGGAGGGAAGAAAWL